MHVLILWHNTGTAGSSTPDPEYDGIHRYDTEATWTSNEEKDLVRKIDLRIMLYMCWMFFWLRLDGASLGKALADNFLKDVHATTGDYNLSVTLQSVLAVAVEIPAQMIMRRVGAEYWLPGQMLCWGAISVGHAFVRTPKAFIAVRCLLTVFTAGWTPALVSYISEFYTTRELGVRMSWLYACLGISDILSAFVAFGLLHLRGRLGLPGWSWMFIVEGILTIITGIVTLFYLPASPTQSPAFLRFRSFSDREEVIMVNRILRDEPAKGKTHRHSVVHLSDVRRALHYSLWPLYIIGLVTLVPPGTTSQYFSLTLRSIGFDTFRTNLLTIPSSFLLIVNMLWLSLGVKKWGHRAFACFIGELWIFPNLVALAYMPKNASKWAKWAASALTIAYPYWHPVALAWTASNSNDTRTRSISVAIYTSMVSLSGVIASNIYVESDAPDCAPPSLSNIFLFSNANTDYHIILRSPDRRGNKILVGISGLSLAIFLFTHIFYKYLNHRKDRAWRKLSIEQQQDYAKFNKTKGPDRLDFRYLY
ncbi:hypothetical protein BS47DRAFT_1377144 [Hydnum rufescens UP504]|uniref:MFS general substrate transporter n=1 Tax=Hydnum rufescens UP504 TaxID=1448309 RepID=A0A9P6ATL2_9AGAM|nr:hypothetical protein BS47DRAFT_1377144 [Hydnum rufescens UP504]